MTRGSKRLEHAYMNSEPMIQFNGLEQRDYVNTFLEMNGDEPQCLRTTHSSMYPLWSGYITLTPPSSSTRYQWAELYAAWKLVIPSPNLQKLLDSLQKAQLYTAPTDYLNSPLRLSKNSPSTVRMTCTCAKKFSNDSVQGIPNPNCV